VIRVILTDCESAVDGIASWSAALIGSECKIPVEFFLDSADEHYIQLKSNENHGMES